MGGQVRSGPRVHPPQLPSEVALCFSSLQFGTSATAWGMFDLRADPVRQTGNYLTKGGILPALNAGRRLLITTFDALVDGTTTFAKYSFPGVEAIIYQEEKSIKIDTNRDSSPKVHVLYLCHGFFPRASDSDWPRSRHLRGAAREVQAVLGFELQVD